MKISEIEPIHFADEQIERMLQGTRGCIVTREELKRIVEMPCLEATLALYDKNIRTTSTDANKNTIGFNGYIAIDISSLREENQFILKTLYPNEYERAIKNAIKGECVFSFEVPINEESTVEKVSKEFMDMTESLQVQDVLYGKESLEDFASELMPMYGEEGDTIEDMIAWIKEPSTIESLRLEGVFNGLEYIDVGTDTIWRTKELYDKHIKYLEQQKEKTTLQEKDRLLTELEQEAKIITEAENLIEQKETQGPKIEG